MPPSKRFPTPKTDHPGAEAPVRLSLAQFVRLGMGERLLPHVEELAQSGSGWRDRRRAARYARELGALR